jgi:hypothetical protein
MTNNSTRAVLRRAAAADDTRHALQVLQDAMLKQVWEDRAGYIEAQRQLWASVRAARDNGVTWEKLGELLGVSRSAAQQRFSKPAPGELV